MVFLAHLFKGPVLVLRGENERLVLIIVGLLPALLLPSLKMVALVGALRLLGS